MMGKNFTGYAADVPRMARRFADAILEAATGQKGPFDSKLAFVSTGGGRFKEIYTQTIDGGDLFSSPITRPSICSRRSTKARAFFCTCRTRASSPRSIWPT